MGNSGALVLVDDRREHGVAAWLTRVHSVGKYWGATALFPAHVRRIDGALDISPGKVYLGTFGEVRERARKPEDIPEDWAGGGYFVYIEAGFFEKC